MENCAHDGTGQAAVMNDDGEMVTLPGGTFRMGSNRHYPEEAPERMAQVDAFAIDRYPVTNAQFAAFVADTGYVTFAEIAPDPADYPGMPAEMARAGSAVFCAPAQAVPLDNPGYWWRYVFGADWRHPEGPDSSIDDKADHPVVQVAYQDALAYARWCDKDLPTEAEHEYASGGGVQDQAYAWGDELAPSGRFMANYWHGQFPIENTKVDGYLTTSPVGAFPANGFGLYDMIGNVWEWTQDWYGDITAEVTKTCCSLPRARRATAAESRTVSAGPASFPRKVLKGGSHLCAENYCRRFRPAARHPQQVDSPTSHIGFRCVRRLGV